jgi:hypothetical protein
MKAYWEGGRRLQRILTCELEGCEWLAVIQSCLEKGGKLKCYYAYRKLICSWMAAY